MCGQRGRKQTDALSLTAEQWKVKKPGGTVFGPIGSETILKWIREQRVWSHDLLSHDGEDRWLPARSVPEFTGAFSILEDKAPHQTHELFHVHPDCCACPTLSTRQKVVLAAAVAVSAAFLYLDWVAYVLTANIFCAVFYAAFSLYKVDLVARGALHGSEMRISKDELRSLARNDLPVYTLLIPLYREARVLPRLKEALDSLDYPREKLDIKLLLEEDDARTVEAVHKTSWGPEYETLMVPDSVPRTKPKACNYGLAHARGDFLVIFDAEDRPEPDQLKKAVAVFRRLKDKKIICLQAKLNYYNQDRNLLTKWFTCEYSTWFDLYLPGLAAAGAPIPLGGTSNHFRTSVLRELCGWDPFNVAEDCDLGVRIHRFGYRTRMMDSTTWEEACSHPGYWLRQRSRWIKGYVQTYLVHTRHPWRLMTELGVKDWLSFHMIIGGMFFCFLINPFFWMLTALWLIARAGVVSTFFPGAVFALAAACLFIGGFSFVYLGVAGVLRRGYFHLVKYSLLIPVYWVMISIGAWKGVLQLLRRPHFWEKTKHGLAQT